MHQTNTNSKTIPPNVNDLLNAMERFKEQYRSGPRDFKIHPDDFEELKRQAAPYLPHPLPGPPAAWMGVALVIDPEAERLPRKRL